MAKISLTFIIIFLLMHKLNCAEINGTPKIIDGDTIHINNKKIRLEGIDAPEIKQQCKKRMVRNGYAVAYKRYSKDYVRDEEYAKENKLGVWEGSFTMPEKWRKLN